MTTRLNPRHPHPPCICTDCGFTIRKGDGGADLTYGCCVNCRWKRGVQQAREKIRRNGPVGSQLRRRLDYSRGEGR